MHGKVSQQRSYDSATDTLADTTALRAAQWQDLQARPFTRCDIPQQGQEPPGKGAYAVLNPSTPQQLPRAPVLSTVNQSCSL